MSDNMRFPEINDIAISGRLVDNPIIRETHGGKPVGNFRIASNRRFLSKEEWQDETTYINVVVWNKGQCDRIQKSLKKGSGVYVKGRLRYREWFTKDNEKRGDIEIVASRVQFIDRFERSSNWENENFFFTDDADVDVVAET